MDFKLGETEERLRHEVRKFAREEMKGNVAVSGLEEERRDEDWEFTIKMRAHVSRPSDTA